MKTAFILTAASTAFATIVSRISWHCQQYASHPNRVGNIYETVLRRSTSQGEHVTQLRRSHKKLLPPESGERGFFPLLQALSRCIKIELLAREHRIVFNYYCQRLLPFSTSPDTYPGSSWNGQQTKREIFKQFRPTPISFITVMPAALASSSSACIAGDTYDVVTTCFFALIAAFTTATWYV